MCTFNCIKNNYQQYILAFGGKNVGDIKEFWKRTTQCLACEHNLCPPYSYIKAKISKVILYLCTTCQWCCDLCIWAYKISFLSNK